MTNSTAWAYAGGASTKKVDVGFSRPIVVSGAQAPTSLGAFFVPEGFLYGCVHGETFGSAGFRKPRSANPVYVATILFSSEPWRLVINLFPGAAMPNSPFTVREDVTPAQLVDHIHVLSNQALALSQSINDGLTYLDDLKNPEFVNHLYSLAWLQTNVLEQQVALCEHLEGMG